MTEQQSGSRLRITERALAQRLNRKLAADDQRLRKSRSERMEIDLGEYFIVDVYRNVIVEHHVDLETMGRSLGVLQPYEEVIPQ